MAADIDALTNHLGMLTADDDLVVVLTGSNYDFDALAEINDTNAEVAILGDGSTTIGTSSTSAILSTGGSAILYLSGLVLGPDNATGIDCTGTSVWLDDTTVSGNSLVGLDISSGCAAHLRRSVVRGNQAGGSALDGGSISAEVSAIVANVNGGTTPGIRILAGEVNFTYTTIANNLAGGGVNSIECLPAASGSIRNSIVVANDGDTIVGCDGITFENNSLDTGGLGGSNDLVGPYNSAWFVNPGSGNYHISATGEPVFMDDAMWAEGDPLTDIDGHPIPTDMPSFTGFDQP